MFAGQEEVFKQPLCLPCLFSSLLVSALRSVFSNYGREEEGRDKEEKVRGEWEVKG